MPTTINHVSVNALNLRESVDFYVELLGAEPIPTPNFGLPVQWLALGRTQLHLFERDSQASSHHHLGITVDDLEPVYRVAERLGAFDRTAFRNHLVELPGNVVQLYIRDPAGNLVELDQHGAERLPDDLRAQLKPSGSSTRKASRTCGAGCSCPSDPRGVYPWRTGPLYDGQIRPATHENRCRRCVPLTSPASPLMGDTSCMP